MLAIKESGEKLIQYKIPISKLQFANPVISDNGEQLFNPTAY
jgi:hypothetical protein